MSKRGLLAPGIRLTQVIMRSMCGISDDNSSVVLDREPDQKKSLDPSGPRIPRYAAGRRRKTFVRTRHWRKGVMQQRPYPCASTLHSAKVTPTLE
jgi:hypothetical protein